MSKGASKDSQKPRDKFTSPTYNTLTSAYYTKFFNCIAPGTTPSLIRKSRNFQSPRIFVCVVFVVSFRIVETIKKKKIPTGTGFEYTQFIFLPPAQFCLSRVTARRVGGRVYAPQ